MVMLTKTLTLHSLTYLVGITSSVAVHQNALWSLGTDPADASQIVVRAAKSDRLPVKLTRSHARDTAPVRVPTRIKPGIGDACQQPVDVRGRCFASVALSSQDA
ncbi:hypothetical protein EAS56_13900 [Bradyrhizobium guangzhouense]|uniref:Uncharacterized protein n=2 Tax=Bradyrhizobium guangzhouense TaxID=1325095 RepID=A0AAE5X206_9BRAD|nr:hypothetical protein XH91_19090 [Bradyrhizobium guangzhouense]RXH13688.1 hypothetical protein EAS56_13900 [Bradyrhizobium guangzhouense]